MIRFFHSLLITAVLFSTASPLFANPPRRASQPYEYAQQAPTSRWFSIAFIDKAKRLVFLNAGLAHGINKGDRVCILDQYRVKIGCFRIRIINRTSAAFKPTKKKLAKMNSGMLARFAEDDEQLDDDSEDSPSHLELGFTLSALTPHAFNLVDFVDNPDTGGARLQKKESVRSNYTGFLVGSQIALSSSFGLGFGLLARVYQPLAYDSEYEFVGDARYSHEYSVVGVGVPFGLRWYLGSGRTQFILSEGVQWDLSYLKYRLYSEGEADGRELLLKHVSVLNTLSLRADIGASFQIGKASRINTMLGVLFPVSRFAPARATSGQVSPEDQEELEVALAHDKAKVGVDLGVSFLVGF